MVCCVFLRVHSNFVGILIGKREIFALFVFLVSHDCCVALPRDATNLSSVYDCGISCSYSLLFLVHFQKSITNNQTDVPKSKCPELVNLYLFSNCDTISRSIYATDKRFH